MFFKVVQNLKKLYFSVLERFMKQLYLGILVLSLTSCKYFDVKKTSSEAILKEKLETFDWNDVDEYPSFSFCDSLIEKQAVKQCFENYITRNILENLEKEKLVVTHDVSDTIELDFQISEKGAITLSDFEVDSLTLREIPDIKSLIQNSIGALPKIYPATKQGQQVKTKFELPLVIHVK